MLRNVILTIMIISLLVISSCSQISVKTDYDKTINFQKYQSFKIMDMKQHPKASAREGMSPLMEKRLRNAIKTELTSKGYEYIEMGKADLKIAIHSGVKNKVDVQHYGYRHGRWHRPVTKVTRYKEGTLVIDLIDTELNELVWRGIGSGVIKRQGDPDKKINESITAILKKFPPGE